MSAEAWQQLQQVLADALDRPEGEREEFLARAAAGDGERLATLQRLLRAALTDSEGGLLAPPARLLAIQPLQEPPPGRLDDFELLEELGRGAMGVVHRARQRSLDREVALKLLMPQLAFSSVGVERFRLEATAHARLRHPNIVAVHVVGEDRGTHFFAMDHVPGASLKEVLTAMTGSAERPAARQLAEMLGPGTRGYFARVATLVASVADALEHSHKRGIVHRDVKPGNILLDLDGVPHVTDFGVAKDMQLEALLQTDHGFGTPHYMSPEQASRRGRPIDRRTDIYSLGVVLFELLTRQRPFEGDTREQVLAAIVEREPPAPARLDRNVHRDLQTICLHALEKQPAQRYASAAAMAEDLRCFLAGEPIAAVPPSAGQRVGRWLARRRLPLAALAVLLLAVAASAVLSVQRERRTHRAQALQPLRELLALQDGPLAEQPPQRLVEAQRACDRLLEDGSLDEAGRADLRALAARLDLLGRRELAAADALVAQSTRDSSWRATGRALQAGAHVGRGALLLPDDQDVQRRAEPTWWLPRLTLRSTPPGATVTLLRLDPASNTVLARERLQATTPIEALPVEVDFYRIVLELEGFGFAEVTRALLVPREEHVVDVPIRPTQEVLADGMLLVAGGPVDWGEGSPDEATHPPRRDVLEPFWIDRAEVSNASYRRFVQATGRPAPPSWHAGYDAAWDALPVVHVECADAEAYAAWAGKRLPTVVEWLAAARGNERRRFPWGDDAQDVLARAVLQRPSPSQDLAPDRERTLFAAYLAATLPADALPQGAGPSGVQHALGNVREWTESPGLLRGRHGTAGEPLFASRLVMGGDWREVPFLWDLRGIGVGPVDHGDEALGFRCAKSARP